MQKKLKIAFLYLDKIHQLSHIIGPAIELAKTEDVKIITFPAKHEFLYDTIKRLGGNRNMVEKRSTKAFRGFTDKFKGRKQPRKSFWLKKNKAYLLGNFDALVFTDYDHHYIYNDRGKKKEPKLIYIAHGVSGHAYAYKKDILDFDSYLLWGKYVVEHLKKLNRLPKHHAEVGYPKLDVIPESNAQKLFNNDKPIVVYNPHFKSLLSSWNKEGIEILEFFYNQKEYNLIFAPHLQLFSTLGKAHKEAIPQKYFDSAKIHIDLGSVNSVTMTYTQKADLYLGDVSSQVYEFLLIGARPCVFINTHHSNYKDDENYRFWQCGPVIEDSDQLEDALQEARKNSNKYRPIQEKITQENFTFPQGITSSEKIAEEIIKFLK